MGIGDLEKLVDVGDGGGKTCSICLDFITDSADRSFAKLLCGHLFHLDCIGSAFNVKGAMQCPNCRKIEKGQWLYSNGSRPYAEFNMEDWIHEEDLYDLNHSEMSFGVHWCPFGGLTRLPSSFDEGELSPTAYHDLLGQHAVFAEHTAVSSGSHHCPYVAYFGPFPSSSNSSGSVSDGSSFSSHWNSRSAPIAAPDQPSLPSLSQRATRNNFDNLRSGSFVHPFTVGHGAGSSIAASMFPPYPGSAARARERAQALQASQGLRTPVMPTTRRSNGYRNIAQGEPVALSSEQANGFYFFPSSSSAGRNFAEAENSMPNHVHAWERDQFPSFPSSQAERDPIRGPIHQRPGAPDTGMRPASFRQRHGSERMPSQHRS